MNPVFKSVMLVGVITFLIYIPALFCDFVNFDDPQYVYGNLWIRNLDIRFIVESFTSAYMGWWMPLVWISFAIDYQIWGADPFGYHLTNNLLHALNAGLVTVLAHVVCREVFRFSEEEFFSRRSYLFFPVFAALFFGLHPVNVESVAWVSERKNVLSTFFALNTLIFYARYASSVELQRRRCYMLSLLFFALSLMAKPVVVVIPVMMFLADLYPFDRVSRGTIFRLVLEKLPHALLASVTAIATVMLASGQKALVPLSLFSLADRSILSGYAVFEYVRSLIAPSDMIVLNLIPPVMPISYTLKALTVAGVSIVALITVNRCRWFTSVWFFFLLALMPSLHFFINGASSYNYHFLYLPLVTTSIAVTLVLFWLYIRYGRKSLLRRRISFILLAGLLIFYAGYTIRETGVWKDSNSLWSRFIEVDPAGRAYYYRADHFMSRGDYDAAAADFAESITKGYAAGHPEVYTLHAFRGDALRKGGRNAEALQEYSTALSLAALPNFYYYRSLTLRALGRNGEADADLQRSGGDSSPVTWQYTRKRDDLTPRK